MKNNIKAYNSGSIPVIYEMCQTGNICEIINETVNWREDNTKVSPGILTESLIIGMISGRKPLWKMEEFWKKQDTNYLFGDKGIKAEQLNDDAYGRLLDKLSNVNMQEIVSKLSLNLLKKHGETIKRAHLDTTSISVEGEYSENVDGDKFDLKRGHSKDHRPDLKQFKIGLAVQESGLPIMGELLSGNKSDKSWNPEAVKKMKNYFDGKGYDDIVYVGDSATVSSYESLKDLENIKFISRFPENFKLVKDLKLKALEENNWTNSGMLDKDKSEKYFISSYEEEIENEKYRFVVVHSKELRKKKEKTIKRRDEKEKELLILESNKLLKKEFACDADARKEMEEFISKKIKSRYTFENNVLEIVKSKYSKKGRPSKESQKQEFISYHCEIKIGERNVEDQNKQIDLEGCFVLITSLLDNSNYSAINILEEYKCQNSVELAFKFLKQPVYLGPIFLKNKRRVEALGYIFILVLIIASFFEYKVRKSLKENKESFPQPRNRTTDRPTVKTILETFENILILVIDGKRYYRTDEDKRLFKVIK